MRVLIKYPKSTIIVFALFSILFAYGLTKLETQNSFGSDLPAEDPIQIAMETYKSRYNNAWLAIVGIETPDILDSNSLKVISKISDKFEELDGVLPGQVKSLSTAKRIIETQQGIEILNYLEEIPGSVAEKETLKKQIIDDNTVYELLISKDMTFALVVADVIPETPATPIYLEMMEFLDSIKTDEIKFYLSGGIFDSHEIDLGIDKDISLLLPLCILFIIIGLAVSFKTLRGVLIPLLIIVLSIVWTMGFMGLVGIKLTIVTSILPMLMIAISSSYGIHMLHRYYEEVQLGTVKESIISTVKNTRKPIIMTGITSAIGTATLIVFKINSIKEFGVISAVGIIFVFILTLFLLPSILAVLKKPQRKAKNEVQESSMVYSQILSFSLKNKVKIFITFILLVLLSFIGIKEIKIGADFAKYFPKEHRVRTTYNVFNKKMGGVFDMVIMIDGSENEIVKDPQFLKKVDSFQSYLKQSKHIGRVNSVIDILKQMNKTFNNNNPDYYVIPNTKEEVAQYYLTYQMSGSSSTFEQMVDFDYKSLVVHATFNTSELIDHQTVFNDINEYWKQHKNNEISVSLAGRAPYNISFTEYIVKGKLFNILLAIIVVWLFCTFIFKSFKYGLISIIPLSISSILTFGLMGFVGVRLEMGTAIISAIGIGIGVDFSIHFICRYRQELKNNLLPQECLKKTIETSGHAIMLDVLSNVLGFSVFVFSGFTPIQAFGWLVCFTMITVALTTIVLLPPILSLLSLKE